MRPWHQSPHRQPCCPHLPRPRQKYSRLKGRHTGSSPFSPPKTARNPPGQFSFHTALLTHRPSSGTLHTRSPSLHRNTRLWDSPHPYRNTRRSRRFHETLPSERTRPSPPSFLPRKPPLSPQPPQHKTVKKEQEK